MKRLFLALSLLLLSIGANAQFVNGQVLTATALNAALAGPNITSGTINGAVIGGINPSTGIFTNLTVTGTLTAPISIGNLAPQAANTVIANATGSTASPTAVSLSNCAGISSALNYTNGSGFSCNGSINALTLGGATFSSPGPIGSVSPSTGAFSSVNTPSATIGGGSINATTVGATSPSTGAFTTLNASSTVTLPAGSVPLTELSTQAANTIVANATGGSASPTATSAPSCSTTSSALNWTTSTGLSCNTTINASTLGGTAAASYALLASPTFTGTPAAPTTAAGTSTTQLATTAFVSASPIITTPTINGVTSGVNAGAGVVGQVITNTSSAIGITTATNTNTATATLTAGDWDVTGSCIVAGAGTTVITSVICSIGTTSATQAGNPYQAALGTTLSSGAFFGTTVPTLQENVSSSQNVFLVCAANFTVSTATCQGYLFARRRR